VRDLRIAQDPAADEPLGRDPFALLLAMFLDQHMRRRSSWTLAEAAPDLARQVIGWLVDQHTARDQQKTACSTTRPALEQAVARRAVSC
jgi:erythromycin esterase-like protein